MSADIEAHLKALLIAAARAFDAAARAHAEDRPEDALAFAALALDAGAKPTVRIGLFPDPVIEVGYVHAGEWRPLFTWSASGPTPDDRTLN